MRILYISEIYPDVKRRLGIWGGGEKQFYEISRRAANSGHEVTILTCQFPSQPREEVVSGMRIFRTGLSRNPNTGNARKEFLPVVSYILKTAKNALKFHYDVIHCNTFFPVYAGRIVSHLKQTPLITTFHDTYRLKDWIDSQNSVAWGLLGHFVTIMVTKLSHGRIIAVSPQCRQKLLSFGLPDKRITVIPNGVDLRLFDSVNVRKVSHQVLYVGRLVSYKHVDWLISAFVKVVDGVSDAKLKIVGSGPEWRNLHDLVRKLGLYSHVTFTGKTPTYETVARYFRESEVFVLPSTVEGEGIVLKEAMAACLPVIAMNVQNSGVLNLVRDGENGFLVEPKQLGLLAERIVELLMDETKRKKMGAAGREYVEKYDWEIIANRTLQVYKEAMV